MTFNLARGVEVLAQIEIARLTGTGWDQNHWAVVHAHGATRPPSDDYGHVIVDGDTGLPMGVGSCTTAFCAAGWAAQNSGAKMRWRESHLGEYVAEETVDGQDISDVAVEWFGIERPEDWDTERWADDYNTPLDPRWDYANNSPYLFDGDNDIDEMYSLMFEYTSLDSVEALRALVEVKMREMLAESCIR